MRRNDVVNILRKMSNVYQWRYWVNGEPSPRRGVGVRSILYYPPYYLYFGYSRPYIVISADTEGYFVPPDSWEPSWDTTQWKFIEKNFSKRDDIQGLDLPSYLSTISKFLTYIHKIFTLLDLLETKEGELVSVVREWTRIGGNPSNIVFPSLEGGTEIVN